MNNLNNKIEINNIYNGDCVVGMQCLANESVDCVITDPPYLVNYKDRDGRSVAGDSSYNAKWLDPACAEMFRVLKNNSYAVVFYGANHIEKFVIGFKKAGFRIAGNFAFVKDYASSKRHLAYKHECAFLLTKGNPKLPKNPLSSVITGWKYTKNEYHPTQKPVNILSMLVSAYSQENDLILDPFMGSGSTAIASLDNKRHFIGFELDTQYHTNAMNRLQKYYEYLNRTQSVQVQNIQQYNTQPQEQVPTHQPQVQPVNQWQQPQVPQVPQVQHQVPVPNGYYQPNYNGGNNQVAVGGNGGMRY
jgi:DNA modification methylase